MYCGKLLIMFSNHFANSSIHKDSFKRTACDYVIRFHSEQNNLDDIVKNTYEFVKHLVYDYHKNDETVSGRLILKVNYHRVGKEKVVTYYHSSPHTEIINSAEDFYFTHMLLICNRMDDFNRHGSNLLVKNVEEIHFHVNVLNK